MRAGPWEFHSSFIIPARVLFRFFLAQFCHDNFKNNRQDGNDDNGIDNEAEVVLDKGQIAQEESRRNKRDNPDDAADDIEEKESCWIHQGNAGHKGRESSHNGDKTGQDDGFAAMTLDRKSVV